MNISNIPTINNINDFYNFITTGNIKNNCFELYRESRIKQFSLSKQNIKLFLMKFRPTARFIYNHKYLPSCAMHEYKVCHFIDDLINNKDKYIRLFNKLNDDESKQTLINILFYKLTFDNSVHKGAYRPIQDQYLDSQILSFNANEVVADCGAFIGDNALSFFKYMKTAKKYYLIEPDPENMQHAKYLLSKENFKNIEYVLGATNSSNEIISFTSFNDGGHLSKDGSIKVQAYKLDDLIKEPLTFIKMDIEGSELVSIKGAHNQILNNKPKLAICAYHKPEDLWILTQEILNIRSDYKVYLRQYGDTCEEVLYFV